MKNTLSALLFLIISQALGARNQKVCLHTLNAFGPIYGLFLEERMRDLGVFLNKEDIELWNGLNLDPKMSKKCEIIFFQEIWTTKHQALLSQSLGEGYRFYPFDPFFQKKANDEAKFGHAMAILKDKVSVDEVIAKRYTYNFSGFADWFREALHIQKGFSYTQLSLEEGRRAAVIQTHLHHASAKLRFLQLMQLAAYIRGLKAQPPIFVLGDFNASRKSLEMQLFSMVSGVRFINQDHPCTYCSENPYSLSFESRAIDHVGVVLPTCSNGPVLNMNSYVYPRVDQYEKSFSDHYGLRIFFEPLSKAAAPIGEEKCGQKAAIEQAIKDFALDSEEAAFVVGLFPSYF